MALTQSLILNGDDTQSGAGDTQTGHPIGTAASDRWVLLSFTCNAAAPGAVTIGGVAATSISDATLGAAIGWAWANVPTGTTADITISGSSGWAVQGIWAIYGSPSIARTANFFDLDFSGSSFSLNVTAGGSAFGVAIDASFAATTVSWTAGLATEGANRNVSGIYGRCGGANIASSSSLTCSYSSGYPAAWAISFEPVASGITLSATGLAGSSPSLGQPSLGIRRNLTATAFAGAAHGMPTPSLVQKHSLTATAFAGSSPSLGTPSTGGVVSLTATAFSGASPALVSPSLTQRHSLTATAFSGVSPSLGSPSLVQQHGLTATAFAGASRGSPTPMVRLSTLLNPLDKDADFVIGANGLHFTVDSAVAGARSIGGWKSGKHAFSVSGYFNYGGVGPGISNAGASRVSEDPSSGSWCYHADFGGWIFYRNGTVVVSDGTATPPAPNDEVILYCDSDNNLVYAYSVGAGAFLAGGNPVAGTGGVTIPAGPHFAMASSDALLGGPVRHMEGDVNFNPENLVGGYLPWGQGETLIHFLTASNFAGASPSLGAPTLSLTGMMAAVAFAGASPSLGTPSLGVTRNLSATSFAGGSPALGAPALGQRHSLTAVSHAGASPVLGTPTFSIAGQIAAVAFSGSSPGFTLPTLNQRHAVIATAIGTGPPALGPASLSQRHGLAATPFAGASPGIGTPALTQQHSLSATSFAGTSPGLGTPGLTQRHALSATPFAGAAAALGQPSVVLAGQMVALPLAGASPVLGLPTLVQRHVLTPTPFAGAAAALGTPAFGAAGGLTAVSFAGASPVLGMPILRQAHALASPGHAGAAAAIGQPAIGQRHLLAGTSISSTTSIGTPFFGDVLPVVFTALGFAGSPPAMTKPYLSTTKFVPKPGRTLGGLRPRVRSLVNGKPRARSL